MSVALAQLLGRLRIQFWRIAPWFILSTPFLLVFAYLLLFGDARPEVSAWQQLQDMAPTGSLLVATVIATLLASVHASKLTKEPSEKLELLEELLQRGESPERRGVVLRAWSKLLVESTRPLQEARKQALSKRDRFAPFYQDSSWSEQFDRMSVLFAEILGRDLADWGVDRTAREARLKQLIEGVRTETISVGGESMSLESGTEEVLNELEYLGKLFASQAFDVYILKTFYYTVVADTYLLLLPFILNKRTVKDEYCQHVSKLLRLLPETREFKRLAVWQPNEAEPTE